MKLQDFVIFGGTGDLALRKLMPALFYINKDGQLLKGSRVLSISRSDISQAEYLDKIKINLQKGVGQASLDDKSWESFSGKLHFLQMHLDDDVSWGKLVDWLKTLKAKDTIYYLAVPPGMVEPICQNLEKHGLNNRDARIVVEKPFGEDLQSAIAINDVVSSVFSERQIYRIDHYLGKEMVQNILALRFGNRFLEKIWDREHIEYIQITVAESVGVEGRIEYLDRAGVMRDMVQNHLMQLLSLIALESPPSLRADDIRDAKVKVLKSLRPVTVEDINKNVVIAQYERGYIDGSYVSAYREEIGSAKGSGETFVAIRAFIDNERWRDVPFYLRTGKRLKSRFSEIVVKLRRTPSNMFGNDNGGKLVIRLQPEMQVNMDVFMKKLFVDGLELVPHSKSLRLDNGYDRIADAYEKLVLDVLRDVQACFVRRDEIEASWEWIDGIRRAREETNLPMQYYVSGSEGPDKSRDLVAQDGHTWFQSMGNGYA